MFYPRVMERIGIRELNQDTSRYIAMVKAGETIEITERGRLVAKLVPISQGENVLERMVAQGRAIPPTHDPATLLSAPPSDEYSDVNLADVVAEMREEERW